jgi:hypothetical protein
LLGAAGTVPNGTRGISGDAAGRAGSAVSVDVRDIRLNQSCLDDAVIELKLGNYLVLIWPGRASNVVLIVLK